MEPKEPISWRSSEYDFRSQSPDWYWALGILAVAGAATAIIFHDPLFAIVILVGAFSLMLFGAKKPTVAEFTVHERGIKINQVLYPYATLESFWIEDREGAERLILKSRKFLMPYIVIPLAASSVSAVDDFLGNRLPKEEHQEPVAHRLMEFFGL